MTSSSLTLKNSHSGDDAISSCYFDVEVHTDTQTIRVIIMQINASVSLYLYVYQAHKMILAQRSPWFHKLFSQQRTGNALSVVFFGFGENIVQAVINVIYGKTVIVSIKDKGRVIALFKKLGVEWSEKFEEKEDLASRTTEDSNKQDIISKNSPPSKKLKINEKESVKTPDPTLAKQPSAPPPLQKKSTEMPMIGKRNSNEEDLYAILDSFTETSEEELERIKHTLVGENRDPNRKYKCTICKEEFKHFTQARNHHEEHEFLAFKPIREALRKAELDRQRDDKHISDLEKQIGKTEKKSIKRALK